MSVREVENVIRLEGVCGVEEAEVLAALLDESAERVVDLSTCTRLHGALVQALLEFRPRLGGGPPEDVFIRDFLYPALASARKDG